MSIVLFEPNLGFIAGIDKRGVIRGSLHLQNAKRFTEREADAFTDKYEPILRCTLQRLKV